MHSSDGELRAMLDGQLSAARRETIQAHLRGCPRCRARLEILSRRAEGVARSIASLPAPSQTASSRNVLTRLQRQINEKETKSMWKQLTSPRYHLAWAILILVVILAAALTIPSVNAIANSFLGLFRVQQITVISVDPGDTPARLASSAQLEALLSQKIQYESQGEPQTVANVSEASSLAGIPVRLPSLLGEPTELSVSPTASAAFQVDLPRMQAILDEIGRSDIRLPAELDGATVTLSLPALVTAQYGKCTIPGAAPDTDEPAMSPSSGCITLAQMLSPSISAPPGLDVATIGEVYLQTLGMTPEEAKDFSRKVDWTTTLVIPIRRYGTVAEDVMVDGVSGSLIQESVDNVYLLIWVKDGILYALSGPGSGADALEIANSMK